MAATPKLVILKTTPDSQPTNTDTCGEQHEALPDLAAIDAALGETSLTPRPGLAHLVLDPAFGPAVNTLPPPAVAIAGTPAPGVTAPPMPNSGAPVSLPSIRPLARYASTLSGHLTVRGDALQLGRRAMIWITSAVLLGSLAGSLVAWSLASAWLDW